MGSISWLAFGIILSGVLLNAIAQLFLKQASGALATLPAFQPNLAILGQYVLTLAQSGALWLGLLCYGVSVLLWIAALTKVPVSVAYPMVSIGYVVNALGAWYFLGESLSLQKIAALLIILAGVALLARG
jgi:multidrug transporter EmrE-like cation transporter